MLTPSCSLPSILIGTLRNGTPNPVHHPRFQFPAGRLCRRPLQLLCLRLTQVIAVPVEIQHPALLFVPIQNPPAVVASHEKVVPIARRGTPAGFFTTATKCAIDLLCPVNFAYCSASIGNAIPPSFFKSSAGPVGKVKGADGVRATNIRTFFMSVRPKSHPVRLQQFLVATESPARYTTAPYSRRRLSHFQRGVLIAAAKRGSSD